MFKSLYLEDLKNKIIVPSGYNLKIVDEISYRNASEETPQTIILLVRFGAATKSMNEIGTYLQPVMFTCYSEAGSVIAAQTSLDLFFKTYSHSDFKYIYNDDDGNEQSYNGVATYVSPTLQKSFNVIVGENRGILIMSGLITYSDRLIIGENFYLDDQEYKVLAYSNNYQTNPVSVMLFGESVARNYIDSANKTHNITFYMRDTKLCKKLLDMSEGLYTGNLILTFKRVLNGVEYISECIATQVSEEFVPSNGLTSLSVTMIKR